MKSILTVLAFLSISMAATMFGCDRHIIERYESYYLPPAGSQSPQNGAIKVTFLGTSMLVFDDGQDQLMIDGFITRPSLARVGVSPIQTNTSAVDTALAQAGVSNRLKAIFTAHSHYDHTLDAAYIAKKTGAKLHGSASTLNIGRGGTVPEDQMSLYQPGTELALGEFRVVVMASKHSPPIPGINNDEGQSITQPLVQPARAGDYKEGGSYDLLIKHGTRSILVKPSANYVSGALDNVQADVLFLGTGTLGSRNSTFRNTFYDQTVAKVHPKLVIPIHWDNFFKPLSTNLEAADDTDEAFDFLIPKLQANNIKFGILQGYQSTILFGPGW